MGQINDESWKEEMKMCKQFLVDSQMKNERQIAFNFAVEVI